MSKDIDSIEKYDPGLPLDKQDFLKQVGNLYGPDLFPEDWDAEEKRLAEQELIGDGRFINGLWQQIPKTCSKNCKLYQTKTCKLSKKPLGKICSIEKAYTEFLIRYYLESLEIDEHDISSVSMIKDLADVEIQIMRVAAVKSNQDFVIDQTIAMTQDGEEITQLQENPIFNVDAKLVKRKQDILKLLAATRSDKMKLIGTVAQISTAQQIAELMKRVDQSISKGDNYGGVIDLDDKAFMIEEDDA